MAQRALVGQDLIDLANDLMAGYANGVDSRALLSYLNMGKDEVWALIKTLKEEYAQAFSQSTDPTADFYFPQLVPGTRQYDLPSDLHSIDMIECTTPDYTSAKFVYRKPTDPDFRNARMSATGEPNSTMQAGTFFYTIVGKNKFMLADYPPTTLTLTLWYTRSLPDFEASDTIDEIVFPFGKKIAEYAVKFAMLGLQDASQFSMWERTWRESVITLMQGAAPRNESDPTFVQDFTGDQD
jgi:hypothetical protein